MGFKKFIGDTLVTSILNAAGQKLGEAIGEVLGQKINRPPVPVAAKPEEKPAETTEPSDTNEHPKA